MIRVGTWGATLGMGGWRSAESNVRRSGCCRASVWMWEPWRARPGWMTGSRPPERWGWWGGDGHQHGQRRGCYGWLACIQKGQETERGMIWKQGMRRLPLLHLPGLRFLLLKGLLWVSILSRRLGDALRCPRPPGRAAKELREGPGQGAGPS